MSIGYIAINRLSEVLSGCAPLVGIVSFWASFHALEELKKDRSVTVIQRCKMEMAYSASAAVGSFLIMVGAVAMLAADVLSNLEILGMGFGALGFAFATGYYVWQIYQRYRLLEGRVQE